MKRDIMKKDLQQRKKKDEKKEGQNSPRRRPQKVSKKSGWKCFRRRSIMHAMVVVCTVIIVGNMYVPSSSMELTASSLSIAASTLFRMPTTLPPTSPATKTTSITATATATTTKSEEAAAAIVQKVHSKGTKKGTPFQKRTPKGTPQKRKPPKGTQKKRRPKQSPSYAASMFFNYDDDTISGFNKTGRMRGVKEKKAQAKAKGERRKRMEKIMLTGIDNKGEKRWFYHVLNKEVRGTNSTSTGKKELRTDTNVCVEQHCLEDIVTRFQLARAFPIVPKSSWCYRSQEKKAQHDFFLSSLSSSSSTKQQTIIQRKQVQQRIERQKHNGRLDQDDLEHNGIYLMRIPKSASSTSAGVMLRIANTHQCEYVFYQHRLAHMYKIIKNDKNRSISTTITTNNTTMNQKNENAFLISSVRDPTKRAISWIFFSSLSIQNSRRNATNVDLITNSVNATDFEHPNEQFLLAKLIQSRSKWGTQVHGQGGFALPFLSLKELPKDMIWSAQKATSDFSIAHRVYNTSKAIDAVADVMNSYSFLLMVERMDESLVALSFIMDGVTLEDIIVLSTKVVNTNNNNDADESSVVDPIDIDIENNPNNNIGGYYYNEQRKVCTKLRKSIVTERMAEYVRSGIWKAQHYGDFLLQAAINKSLDATIEQTIGRAKFEQRLQEYYKIKNDIENQQSGGGFCDINDYTPCSLHGEVQYINNSDHNCYARDFGCGYKCVNNYFEMEKEKKEQGE